MINKHDQPIERFVSSILMSTKTDFDTLAGMSGASLTTATARSMDMVRTATPGITTSPLPHPPQKVFFGAHTPSWKVRRVNNEIDAEVSEHERQEKYIRLMFLFALACFAVLLAISNIGTYVYAQHVAKRNCRRAMFSSAHATHNPSSMSNETTTEDLLGESGVTDAYN